MKKLVLALLALVLMVCVAGCGSEKPKTSADQSILAFAELYAYGGTENAAKTGMTDADIKTVSDQFQQGMMQSFAGFGIPVSEQQELTNYYLDALQENMAIKTKIKTDSDKSPVVEVTITPLDTANFTKDMQTSPAIMQLGEAKGLFQAGGADPAQQQVYVDAVDQVMKELIDNMPMLATKTFEVKCKLAKDKDGKLFWNPEDVQALANNVAGK